MVPRRTLLATVWFLAAAAVGPLATAQQGAPDGDLIVTADTEWAGGSHIVPHDLLVLAPATLRLEGAKLLVGGRIFVAEGARLEMHPGAGQATDIGPLDQSPVNATHGWWMQVNGTVVSSGVPRTELHGIRGDGLRDIFQLTGGIHVLGNATLADVHVHDGTGGVIVAPGALRIENALVENTGFFGLATHARLAVSNTTVAGVFTAIVCHDPGILQVRDSRIGGTAQSLLANGCRADIQGSNVTGAVTPISVTGPSEIRMSNDTIEGFSQSGIYTKNSSPSYDLAGASVLDLDHVTIRGIAKSFVKEAQGIHVQGAELHGRSLTIEGNSYGIFAQDNSLLDVRDSTIHRNNYVGIGAAHSRYASDLLQGNDFGSWTDGTANGRPILGTTDVTAAVLDSYARAQTSVTLKVFSALNHTAPLATTTSGPNATVANVEVQVYQYDLAGQPHFLGPFTYEVTQGSLGTRRGDLDLAHTLIVLHLPDTDSGWVGVLTSPMVLAGLVLCVLGIAWSPLRRMFKARRTHQP